MWGSLSRNLHMIMKDAVVEGSESFDHMVFFNVRPNLSTRAHSILDSVENSTTTTGIRSHDLQVYVLYGIYGFYAENKKGGILPRVVERVVIYNVPSGAAAGVPESHTILIRESMDARTDTSTGTRAVTQCAGVRAGYRWTWVFAHESSCPEGRRRHDSFFGRDAHIGRCKITKAVVVGKQHLWRPAAAGAGSSGSCISRDPSRGLRWGEPEYTTAWHNVN
ncbi:hypothetical protein HPB51_016857 [Rhipicephalus microplus]|uniref:Uncharacterized protein n=1 Tax=Rhipicephalus microplus TaxID=6941 RepID=A0A9J6DIA6_RHIMP|nr:hypothetical protein HPB51_016857 [Rhipicephalus microplus]